MMKFTPDRCVQRLAEIWLNADSDHEEFVFNILKYIMTGTGAEGAAVNYTGPDGQVRTKVFIKADPSVKGIDIERYMAQRAEADVVLRDEVLFERVSSKKVRNSFQGVLSMPVQWLPGGASEARPLVFGACFFWFYKTRMKWSDFPPEMKSAFEDVRRLVSVLMTGLYNRVLHSFPAHSGLLFPEVFRNAVEVVLGSITRTHLRAGLVLFSLGRLAQKAGLSYLEKRTRVMGLIGQCLARKFPDVVLMTFDERNELQLLILQRDPDEIGVLLARICEQFQRLTQVRQYFNDCPPGLAIYPEHGRNADELVKNARAAANPALALTTGTPYSVYTPDSTREHEVSAGLPEYWTDNSQLNYRNTGILIQTIDAMKHLHDIAEVEAALIDKAVEMTGAERGVLLFADEQGTLHFTRGRWANGREITSQPHISQSIPAQVIESGVSLCYLTMDPGGVVLPGKSIQELQLLSVMCTPLFVRGAISGVLYVDSKRNNNEFADIDLTFFQILGRQMGVVLEVAALFEDNKRKQREIEVLNRQLQDRLQEQSAHLLDIEKELAHSHSQLQRHYRYSNLVGASQKMQEVFSLLDRIAGYDYPVLIEGESGTGKELVARAIHFNSQRKDKHFVSENCGAIPETLFESELFGHTKGAFTGALLEKTGLIRLADGGTLFLDEVSNMSDAMQKGMLRVIHEKEMRPVGSKTMEKVDIRLICSSNQSLHELVKHNKFREDLYYRLNVIKIQMPPLRERLDDLPLLVDHFLKKIAQETGAGLKRVQPDVLSLLAEYDWPGNVRELENEIRRLYIFSDDLINSDMVSPDIISRARARSLTMTIDPRAEHLSSIKEQERQLIMAALEKTHGSKVKAARLLGISRTNLYQKLRQYGLTRWGVEPSS